LIHFEELVFTVSTTSATDFVRESRQKIDAADLKREATDVVEDASKIGMNLCGNISFQPLLAILRAEDQMGEEAG